MPEIVLITTTIHVPEVLRLYREIGPNIPFIIVGDNKTPHKEIRDLIGILSPAIYYDVNDQKKLEYKCSETIGWNNIQRRNIAILEAIKLKPKVIITIDDDNLPINSEYFSDFARLFRTPYSGLVAKGTSGWFDIGSLFDPPISHRGFPQPKQARDVRLDVVVNKSIGVAEGLWFGDPDISAWERLANRPPILHMSDVLRAGVVADISDFSPFNSQNTAYLAELAPLMACLPGVGRYDDIWGSYIAQRIMRESKWYTHYGQPFVWQQRHPQDTIGNLSHEIHGMRYTIPFCQELNNMNLGRGAIIEKLSHLYEQLENLPFVPDQTKMFGKTWIKDLEGIL